MKRRLVLGLLAALCALGAVGCGGGGSAAGEGAAGVVPAGVPVYVSVNTDFEGDQITQARELLERFPGSSGLLAMLEAELEAEGDLDFQEDIRPALGPILDVVVLEVPEDGTEPPVVVLLQPEDDAKLEALLAESPAGSRPVTVEVDGWTAVAGDQAVLDRFLMARDAEMLGESEAFEQAMDGIEEDALVRAYFDLPELTRAAAEQAPLQGDLGELVPLSALGAAAVAEEQGFRLEATTTMEQTTENFEPELASELPAGALLYAGFGDVATAVREALNRAGEQNPELDQQLAQLELALGLSLDEDVLPLFEQETAIALYPGAVGADTPSLLLALRVDDVTTAVETVDRVLERAAEFGAVPAPTTSEAGGVQVKEVTLPDGTTVLYGGLEGKLFATNDPELVTALADDGPRLADDEIFEGAQDAAEAPDEVQGLFYANLDAGADYALGLAEESGEDVPSPVRENVEPLRSLFLYGTQDDDRVRVSGFLALDE